MAKKVTSVKIGPEDAAFITRADGKIELVLPQMKGKEDENVPAHVAYVAACAYGLNNEKFQEHVFALLDELEAEQKD